MSKINLIAVVTVALLSTSTCFAQGIQNQKSQKQTNAVVISKDIKPVSKVVAKPVAMPKGTANTSSATPTSKMGNKDEERRLSK